MSAKCGGPFGGRFDGLFMKQQQVPQNGIRLWSILLGPFGGYRNGICGRLWGMKVAMRMVQFERIFFG